MFEKTVERDNACLLETLPAKKRLGAKVELNSKDRLLHMLISWPRVLPFLGEYARFKTNPTCHPPVVSRPSRQQNEGSFS